ncbi:MAG: IS1 family transposase [Thermoanaerobaculaceae bacterium]|jgi:IS1 family transposase
MANILPRQKQEAVLRCLVDGASVRATERITEVHRDTILRLMVRAGQGCEKLMNETMRDLPCRRIEVDELWAYVGKKQRHVTAEDDRRLVGDFWTFVALDPESKLVPTYLVGKRTAANAVAFMVDLSSRLANRVQLSSDALNAYVEAVETAFGADVDYGQIVKSYEAEPIGAGRYSPPRVVATERTVMMGNPVRDNICTSYVERQNLTVRMNMRRFTRLTNAFSKKVDNLRAAVALHFATYNFVRVHRTTKLTPAMAAGVAGSPWTMADLLHVTVPAN